MSHLMGRAAPRPTGACRRRNGSDGPAATWESAYAAYFAMVRDLQLGNPCWLVLWGPYTRRFWAFCCLGVPTPVVVAGTTPDELRAQIRQAEALYAAQGQESRGVR